MKRMTLRMTPAQDARFTRAARLAGVSKSEYARRAIVEAAAHRGLLHGARAESAEK